MISLPWHGVKFSGDEVNHAAAKWNRCCVGAPFLVDEQLRKLEMLPWGMERKMEGAVTLVVV